MGHLLINVVDFEIVGPYTLRIIFDDNQERTIDFEPVLYGHYYGPLRDLRLFDQVRLDPEVHTLIWPNEADFDPATLYIWYRGEGEELAKRASRWRKTQSDPPVSPRPSLKARNIQVTNKKPSHNAN